MSNDKAKLLKGFKKVIDERSLESMNNALYTFFTGYCSFIAHYNIHGFKAEYSGRNFIEFLNHFIRPPYYLLKDAEYGELIQEMSAYAKSQTAKIRFEFENVVLNKKLKILQQLAEELGYEIIPKQGDALPGSIDSSGQISLFE